MEKKETVTDKAEKENGTRGRKEYELTPQAKDKKFEVVVLTRKFKNSTATVLVIDLGGYKKECRLENDEKGFVLHNGVQTKYVGNFCEGVATETGNPYLGIDIWLDKDYYKRDWFTRLEKILLVKQGLLREVK